MERIQTKGLVLYNRDYREDDKLVKIFTEQAGKRMFFVKHVRNSRFQSGIQPLVLADYQVKINNEGLSYIDDIQVIHTFKNINDDLFKLSYVSYILSLADASIQDKQYDPMLFQFLETSLKLIEDGMDYEIVTNIVEIQLLQRFGVSFNFHECLYCHRIGLPFDLSLKLGGVLCPDHYSNDPHRLHVNPNIIYLLDRFQNVSVQEINVIQLNREVKQGLRKTIDQLYDEYVGIHLKAKQFIDSLADWGGLLKEKGEKNEENRS
ncbi:DNA repair protein RecO [Streptococcus sp. DD13]|uniref:DNA repair protein RecO n=1 Tax=Streptococcus sp. DD13 TaxID=1777881 RepID=UPI000793CECD|nr:DNA repair protein RecO [Streptococcus sp. DD13]KXT77262.1 DNA recombination and repair protein RecO [Streptococcus sp. DD13]